MMKKTLLFVLFLASMFIVKDVQAQEFSSAIGARLGYPLSISYKTFINQNGAIEVIGGTRGFSGYRWYMVAGAYQVHNVLDLGDLEGLNWYYGAGAAVYFWNWNAGFGDRGSNTSIGLQGYLGLSYTFDDNPINVSVDWVPTFFLNGFGNGFAGGYGSVGIRYVLGRK
jgi:hypothetical protein